MEELESVSIDWDGVKVEVPAGPDDWDPDVLEAFEQGKVVAAVRGLLGSDAYDKARAEYAKKNGHRPKVRHLNALMEQVATAYGFEGAGE